MMRYLQKLFGSHGKARFGRRHGLTGLMAMMLLAMQAGPARAEWLLQGGAEIYSPFATTITVGDKQAKLTNNKAGGFFGALGYRFLNGLQLDAEYIFLQHRSIIESQSGGNIFNNTGAGDYFYVTHDIALADVGYRFGRSSGFKVLGNFGIYLGSGAGVEVVRGAVAGGDDFDNVAFVLPFKLVVDYKVNETLDFTLYGRYYLPLGAGGTAGGATATMVSAGGLSVGLSLGLIF
ncbi:MAG: hypothetical protein QM529_01095 [Hydrotalea sp.]|nr:hypothetical protein [Hydrotalea sp.]